MFDQLFEAKLQATVGLYVWQEGKLILFLAIYTHTYILYIYFNLKNWLWIRFPIPQNVLFRTRAFVLPYAIDVFGTRV